MDDKIDPIDEFLDLLENKYVIKIKTEANNIPFNKNKIRPGLTYRSNSLSGLLWEAIDNYKKSPISYRSDLSKLISAVKAQGAYEETEGLPRKYQECLEKYNKILKNKQEDDKDFDTLKEEFEKLLKERDELKKSNDDNLIEINKLKMQVEGK